MSDPALLERRHHAIIVIPHAHQAGRSGDGTTMVLEVLGQDGFDNLFGQSQIEPVATAGQPEVHHTQGASVGAQLRPSDLHRLADKAVGDAQSFEDLDRPLMHDRGAVPAERRIMGVDQQAVDLASNQLGGQQKAGRARADDEGARGPVERP